MKKVAILTRRAGYNMGSSLQALAMSKFVKQSGYANEILDYDEYSAYLLWRVKPFIKKIILFILNLAPTLSYRLCRDYYQKLQTADKQMKQFEQFESDYMPLTDRKYTSLKQLRQDVFHYDACICGSDQIWSPYFYDPVFLLSFIAKGENCTKIAYAPSMGTTDASMLKEAQKELIKDFDYVSCREPEASDIVSEIRGEDIPTVLDPTLMVDSRFWKEVAAKSKIDINEKYILTYFLYTSYYQDDIPYKFIESLKRKTGLRVYNVSLFNQTQSILADKQFDTIGPAEFLKLVQNAEWICTNSFHCTIFSYLFERRFFVFERQMKNCEEGGNQNSRIHRLLKLFSMEQCLTKQLDKPNTDMEYDFSVGKSNLERERVVSLKYLNKSLT
ncbi:MULTISPECIES: polysaccharide pyruvyl transferase family protein [Bacteroides]|uniref:polysaccharide pyruvyl transferase family protein n=1 Tax=Bacteroides TaxID=816 RepID=UPI00189EFFBC|nr:MULTISPECIES: polysaccharide pyruvyl transferase family protein [Bacteroides]MDC1767445.1 polysaccharide pyruvyl transferase family protein [Bacteroides uniformis]MDC1771069.1 polysaccharide pyruvyl transferase family protein [Bacteroides uniformis]MDC1777307.1 polysaccharide pyruvyl transferase family protein [Bacteroides uniformis]MDC1778795.1 polysaccharide pyruvyl transferase family protein [Bacteroides uniformis]